MTTALAKRPAKPARPLTPKQQRFVAEYLVDLNATQAAIRSGYSAKTANRAGPALLSNLVIASAVAAGQSKQLAKAGKTAEDVKRRLEALAFADPSRWFDDAGNLVNPKLLPEDVRITMASCEVIKKNAQAGDGMTDIVHKIKTVDVLKPLEMLAKHFGLLIERQDITGSVAIRWMKSDE